MQISKLKIRVQNLKLFRSYKKGYVTITVLILMMVLMGATYLYSDAVFSELAIARNNKSAQAAFSLAEAGVQEAIWYVQYDPTARDKFMNTTDGTTTFSHNPALLDRGAYSVTIQNNAEGVANVNAIGKYTIGTTRTARREINVMIAQAPPNPTYPYDGGVFGGGGAGQSIADIDFRFAFVKIYNGSVLSNRDISTKFWASVDVEKTVEAGRNVDVTHFSDLDCECLIVDDGDPETLQCSENPGCAPLEGVPSKTMPPIDFDGGPNSYKNQAIAQGQYFSKDKDFLDLVPKFGSETFEGVVYIDDNLTIDWARTITINGVIATSGTLKISLGQLFINPPTGGGPSGALTQKDFIVGSLGNFQGTGLVYSGDRAKFDASLLYTINLTGGILSRRTLFNGFRNINIYTDTNIINETIGDSPETPVIEINHWEEEY